MDCKRPNWNRHDSGEVWRVEQSLEVGDPHDSVLHSALMKAGTPHVRKIYVC